MIDWCDLERVGGDLLNRDADAVDVARVIRNSGGYGYMASAYTKRMAVLGHAEPVRDALLWRARFASLHAPLFSPLEAGHPLVTMENGRAFFTGLDGRLQMLPGGQQNFHFSVDDVPTWEILNDPFMLTAKCVVVPPIDGRDHSAGTAREIRMALEAMIPVYVLQDLSR